MKNSTKTLTIILFLTLLVNLVGFFFFESYFLYRVIISIVTIWVWFETFIFRRFEPLIIVTLYLSFFNLNNLYLGISFPLWVLGIIAAIIASGFFFASVSLQLTPHNTLILLYALIIGLASTEIFLALYFWTTASASGITNMSLSSMLVIAFYMLWRTISFHLQNKLNNRLAVSYLVFGSFIILLILLTSS